jgi:hypothetical protein
MHITTHLSSVGSAKRKYRNLKYMPSLSMNTTSSSEQLLLPTITSSPGQRMDSKRLFADHIKVERAMQ